MLTLLTAGSASLTAAPRTLPQEQAKHFCRLLVYDGEGSIYPLSTYADHLTMLVCGEPTYGNYTAEQVFTGIIFFYEDWLREPLFGGAAYENQVLLDELHSGATLRIFPHQTDNHVRWYAPTDQIPEAVGTEHRKYMQEVFSRLNGEVQASNWQTVDAYIDRMIQYQCQFGSADNASNGKMSPIPLIFLALIVLIFIFSCFSSHFSRIIRNFAPHKEISNE